MGEEILWIRGIYKTEMFIRAVIMSKSAGGGGGGGDFPGQQLIWPPAPPPPPPPPLPVATMNVAPGYFHRKTEKIKPKEIPRHLIPRLLVVFTQQLEILLFILTNATNS